MRSVDAHATSAASAAPSTSAFLGASSPGRLVDSEQASSRRSLHPVEGLEQERRTIDAHANRWAQHDFVRQAAFVQKYASIAHVGKIVDAVRRHHDGSTSGSHRDETI